LKITKTGWPQHDYSATRVIAQQYLSATFFSMRFHFRGKKSERG
jgi:hypothetical protein